MIQYVTTSLLALVPPSCIIASIRDSGNKFFSNSATTTFTTRMSIAQFGNMDVDNVHEGSPDNFDDVRGLTKCPANNSSLDIISVTNGSVEYAQHMERNNVLWQPLDTKSNDHTSNKSLRRISSGKFTRELDKEPLLN